MKLAAIINCWDGVELLKYSISAYKDHVDLIIIVYQTISNFGETFDPLPEINEAIQGVPTTVRLYLYNPNLSILGMANEKIKRNIGLDIAKSERCTHWFMNDVDEIYENFSKSKLQYVNSGCRGSVCQMFTYFKKPTLRLDGIEGYFIPFIHELDKDTAVGNYPYPKYCDPTRRVFSDIPFKDSDIILINEKVHHFSWVRRDISLKINNSSARANIAKGKIADDYNNPNIGHGFYIRDYGMKLIEVENLFNIVL